MTRPSAPLHMEAGSSSSDTQGRSTPLLPSQKESSNCCYNWLKNSVWPGLGLFGESYLLFSIGTLQPLWQVLWPDCFKGNICNDQLLHSLQYSVVLGVITGMLLLGYLANSIGRRRGSITTASFMAGGAVGLVLLSLTLTNSPERLFAGMSCLLFVFGIGVGGEYPLAASSASEKAMGEMQEKMRNELERDERQGSDGLLVIDEEPTDSTSTTPTQTDRGRQIQLVFTMQGMGILFNSVTMTALLVITGQVQQDDYNATTLLHIWRGTYALGAAILIYVLVSRYRYLPESTVWQDDQRRRQALARNSADAAIQKRLAAFLPPPLSPSLSQISTVSELSAPSVVVEDEDDYRMIQYSPSTDANDDVQASAVMLLLQNYGVRLWGASLCWLLWDVAFYGNKLFQSTFLLALTGETTTLLEFSMAASLNAAVALCGYFGAAFLLDRPDVGRRRLQQYGFLLTGSLFVGVGFLYNHLSSACLVGMYLGSSFFGQLGPNATTFILPAEIFPTEMRTTCHGICAASGKLGALMAAVLFSYQDDLDLFLVSGYASLVACLVTFWTIPETTGLDLYETDRKWRLILDGRKGDYRGDANLPKFLSYYERHRISIKQTVNDSVHSFSHGVE